MESSKPRTELPPIPSAKADHDERWAYLFTGLEHIMKEDGIPLSGFTNLYSVAYNCCTASKPMRGLTPCQALYDNLRDYFANYLDSKLQIVESLGDMELLTYYANEWSRFKSKIGYVNRVFAFLNRFWVKRNRDEGKKHICEVSVLAMLLWRDHLLKAVNLDSKLTSTTLSLIARGRNGEVIDRGLVKNVVDSFASLGLENGDPKKECLTVYKQLFENPFLRDIEVYCRSISKDLLLKGSVFEYLQTVDKYWTEETTSAAQYLHDSTLEKLARVCEDAFIRDHRATILHVFGDLLEFDRGMDVRRLYNVIARSPDSSLLNSIVFVHTQKFVLKSMSKVAKQGGMSGAVDPTAYVDALLVAQWKILAMRQIVESDTEFAAILDCAYRRFVNCNPAIHGSSTISAELLAKYTDSHLRVSSKISLEDLFEVYVDHIMTLFDYLDDKDAFLKFFVLDLKDRLIHGSSVSRDAEFGVISRLRDTGVCRFDDSQRFQQLFADILDSDELTNDYNVMVKSNQDVILSVKMLSSSVWPMLDMDKVNLSIPPELLSTHEHFLSYYQSRHPGRKFIWLWNHSTNELLPKYLSKRYIFKTSSHQMAILLQFNQKDSLTLQEVLTATAIPTVALIQVMTSLVKAKILIRHGQGRYDLNFRFKSRKLRVKLDSTSQALAESERQYVIKTVDEDRQRLLQASIIRIMKAKRVIRNEDLLHEIISQISHRLTPSVSDIKKAIENLIDNEYIELERIEGTAHTLVLYIA